MTTALRIAALFALLHATTVANAQIQTAPASPRAKLEQQVGLATITLDYGRPGVKGRKVVGGLLPYGKVWRTGANASTKITFSEDVRFGGEDVAAGTYALYTIPQKDAWTVILSKNTKLWGAADYNEAEDALRISVKTKSIADLQESFRIDFDGFHSNGANLVLEWERTRLEIPVFVDTDSKTLADIKAKLFDADEEPSARTYLDAARFYHEKKIDIAQASAWMDKAAEMSPKAFWIAFEQARIAQTLGDIEKARARCEHCLELAKAADWDFGYVDKCKLMMKELDQKQ